MSRDEPSPERAPDLAVLRSACAESRAVLDHQLAVLSDIDDKAIWSVRTAILVLGLVLSAMSIASQSRLAALPTEVTAPAVAGTGCLLATVWVGMLTYHWSFEEFGVGAEERRAVFSRPLDEPRWRLELLALGYATWIDRQERFNTYNQRLLLATHLVLSLGVSLLLIAGGLYLIGP